MGQSNISSATCTAQADLRIAIAEKIMLLGSLEKKMLFS